MSTYSLTLRGEKGQKLTSQELDNNFLYVLENASGSEFNGGTVSEFTQFLGGLSSSDVNIDGKLNIDFTDTLDFFTDEVAFNFGTFYVNPLGWIEPVFTGNVIGSQFTTDKHTFYQLTGEGVAEIPAFGVSFLEEFTGNIVNITSGNLSGSSIGNAIAFVDTTVLSGGESYANQFFNVFVEPITGERTSIAIQQLMSQDGSQLSIAKTNNSGEGIGLRLNNNTTGFEVLNNLSDNSASLFKIQDNSFNNIFEVRNDGVFIDGSPVGGVGGIGGTQYLFVRANGTDTQNAAELQAAYTTAQGMSPSATNRITILAAPGNYNFGSSTFVMDTQYIDLVSLDGNRSIIFNSANALGTISIISNDVFVSGVNVLTKSFSIGNNLSLLKVENCQGGNNSFWTNSALPVQVVSGTFINCDGGDNSFGSSSFNFGTVTTNGLFINCKAGGDSFGTVASGTFSNCTSGIGSFGSTNASGTFTNCTADSGSFGGSFTGSASGTFANCTSGTDSFGGGPKGTLTGKLYYCRLTSGTFKTVSGAGITRLCLDGNNVENNQG